MIQINTTPSDSEYNIASGAEVALKLDHNASANYTIDGVNTGTETFTISDDGDLTAYFLTGNKIEVYGSTGNDGYWKISSVAWSDPDFTITVTGDVTNAVADGSIRIHLDYFRNTTGRTIKPVIQLALTGAKAAKQLTDTATYKFRLYIDPASNEWTNGEQLAFNNNNTFANFITYVCDTAETINPVIVFIFGDFVLEDDVYMFLTVESDNAADNEVDLGELVIYDPTCATGYSATGLDPQVDAVSANDGALAGTADMKAQAEAALRTYEIDHFASVNCESDDITVHVADDSIIAKMLAVDGDISTFSDSTDPQEAIRNKLTDIETDTGEIGTAGAGLNDLGGMSTSMKAEVESEANDALVGVYLDHLCESDGGFGAAGQVDIYAQAPSALVAVYVDHLL